MLRVLVLRATWERPQTVHLQIAKVTVVNIPGDSSSHNLQKMHADTVFRAAFKINLDLIILIGS